MDDQIKDQTQIVEDSKLEETTKEPEEVAQDQTVVSEDQKEMEEVVPQEESAQEVEKKAAQEESTADDEELATDSSDISENNLESEPEKETPGPKETKENSTSSDQNQNEELDEEPKKPEDEETTVSSTPTPAGARWYVVHTYSGHENRVATTLKQRIEAEHLENKIFDILVPTQDKIEIKGGKKGTVKEKIFPGYLLIKMILDDESWLAVRTTQGVTSFIGMGNKPTPISEAEVASIVKFASQGGQPTYKQVFNDGDTVKIVDGPFTEFIGKVDNVDKDRGKVRVLVSIFGRETPVELDFLQVQKL